MTDDRYVSDSERDRRRIELESFYFFPSFD